VRSALVAVHLDHLAAQAARAAKAAEAAKAAPPPAAPIADERVRIRFEGMRPLSVKLDVGMMTGVANGLLQPRPDFLLPRVAVPADDGIERLRPLARR
jgi:hypothetical protein